MGKTIYRNLGGNFVLAIDRSVDRSALVDGLGVVRGAYGAELAERMLSCVLDGLTDLHHEYSAYYSKEYSTFEDFLYWKYSMSKRDIALVLTDFGADRLIGFGSLTSGGDYAVQSWIDFGGGLDFIKSLLKCEESVDEDQE